MRCVVPPPAPRGGIGQLKGVATIGRTSAQHHLVQRVSRRIRGSSRRSSARTCGYVRTFRCPVGCGWSCRCTKAGTVAVFTGNSRCSSRMAFPVKRFG
jgi:hypothetical protein